MLGRLVPGAGTRVAAPPPARAAPAPRARPARRVAAAAAAVAAPVEDLGADFYSILGVEPGAPAEEIKAAYRAAMRMWHPDLAAAGAGPADAEDAAEFASFLNGVYSTLSDPEARAEYDLLAGFAVGGISPFAPGRPEPRAHIFVDEAACIGCRACANVCPSKFEMEEEHGRARARAPHEPAVGAANVQTAVDSCPSDCIHYVTAPQLAVLEETMATIERVPAYLVMRSSGDKRNVDVFFEAHLRWNRRQSERAARAARAASRSGWDWAGAPAGGAGAFAGAPPRGTRGEAGPGGRARVNAAAVAEASRRWRDFQRARARAADKFLSG